MLNPLSHFSQEDGKQKPHLFSSLRTRIGQGDMAVSNSLCLAMTTARSHLIFATRDRETWLPLNSIRCSATPSRLSMISTDFPPGKSLSWHLPGIMIRPIAAKPFSLSPLSQRRRSLIRPMTKVFNSWVEREVSGGVADLSAGSFRHNFSSWSTQTWRSCVAP